MNNALPLRIFLATPGDLDHERSVIRATVDEHNNRRRSTEGISFELLGWDRVRGTARRPQEAINELISESHFMVVLFKQAWGSAPGDPTGYTSGTEEELFTGLLELGLSDQPMRDVWVGFLKESEPAPQVASLKASIANQHALMYESIGGSRDLKDKFAARLTGWEEMVAYKTARHIDLLPSSGRDVLRAANLRIRGQKLIDLGQVDSGRAALGEAAVLGGPVERLALTRFQARHGDLDAAYASSQIAIDFFTDGSMPLHSPLAAEAFAAQASILRAQRREVDAIGRYETALTLLQPGDPSATRVRCRILDNLGLAHQSIKDLPEARRRFEQAHAERTSSADEAGICQSNINLARLEIAEGDITAAATYADMALKFSRATPPTALHPNAEALSAQVRLRQGQPDEAALFAKRALSLNRQLANRSGEAKSLLVLAQCFRAAKRDIEAEQCAQACLDLNTDLKNGVGAQQAQWQLDQIRSDTQPSS